MSSDLYLVVHFKTQNSFTFVGDPLNKLKCSNKANCEIEGQWKTGDIVYRGTKKACQAYTNCKMASDEFEYTDSEAALPGDENHLKYSIYFCSI